MSNEENKKTEILQLLRNILDQDKNLREEFQIGEKFRFIRDRLSALLSHAESNLSTEEKKEIRSPTEAGPEESIVYVYLFNAQGITLSTWHKMVNSAVFYEHSINRPIYKDKSHIESFIRSKSNKTQHGYLSVIIPKKDIQQLENVKDAIGNPLIKVREGSLKFEKLISFMQNGNEYIVNGNGVLKKK